MTDTPLKTSDAIISTENQSTPNRPKPTLLSLLAQGLGVAALYSLIQCNLILYSNHEALYHWHESAGALYGAAIKNILLLWILVCVAGWLARFLPNRPRIILRILTNTFVISVFIMSIMIAFNFPHFIRCGLIAIVMLFTAQILLLFKRRTLFGTVRDASSTVLSFIGILGLVVILQLLWGWWCARDLNSTVHLRSATASAALSAPARARVIWIVMDELSYKQVYDHRYPGIDLPAFDRLRTASTVFTQVIPVGNDTQIVIPALIQGGPIYSVRGTSTGMLQLRDFAYSSWRDFNPRQTIMGDAVQDGYHIGVAGWYNPYCRILPDLLDQCVWSDRYDLTPYFQNFAGWNINALSAIDLTWYFLVHRLHVPHNTLKNIQEASDMSADYHTLLVACDEMLNNPHLDFVFLHLPTPHPPAYYNRQNGRFEATGGSYLDNLVLADKTLAHLREDLERTGEWDSDTIVIMGDHSWRVPNWDKQASWSREDNLASGGIFDTRPGYIVKLPHQNEPLEINTPYRAMRTRDLFDHIFDGSIRTPDQLVAWVQSQP